MADQSPQNQAIARLSAILERNVRAGYMTRELATGINTVFAHEVRQIMAQIETEGGGDDQHQSTTE